MDCTFGKEEHLCGTKIIDELFTHGKSFFSYPYVVYWKTDHSPSEIPARLLIVTPKKKLYHAVDRNRTKRIIRECYRLQKSELHAFLNSKGISISLAVIYTDKYPPKFRKLYERHGTAIRQLMENINRNCNENNQ